MTQSRGTTLPSRNPIQACGTLQQQFGLGNKTQQHLSPSPVALTFQQQFALALPCVGERSLARQMVQIRIHPAVEHRAPFHRYTRFPLIEPGAYRKPLFARESHSHRTPVDHDQVPWGCSIAAAAAGSPWTKLFTL